MSNAVLLLGLEIKIKNVLPPYPGGKTVDMFLPVQKCYIFLVFLQMNKQQSLSETAIRFPNTD